MNPLQAYYLENDIPNDSGVALSLGVNQATVWKWRNDKMRPDHDYIGKLYKLYAIPVTAWYEHWQASRP